MQREPLGLHAIELALDPVADLRRRLERHLVGELVVVAVIALEAVVAGEVALERRQQRDVQFGGVVLDRVEVLVERAPVRLAVRHQEAVLRRAASIASRSLHPESSPLAVARREAVEQSGHVRRHHELRVGERVHQEHFVAGR